MAKLSAQQQEALVGAFWEEVWRARIAKGNSEPVADAVYTNALTYVLNNFLGYRSDSDVYSLSSKENQEKERPMDDGEESSELDKFLTSVVHSNLKLTAVPSEEAARRREERGNELLKRIDSILGRPQP